MSDLLKLVWSWLQPIVVLGSIPAGWWCTLSQGLNLIRNKTSLVLLNRLLRSKPQGYHACTILLLLLLQSVCCPYTLSNTACLYLLGALCHVFMAHGIYCMSSAVCMQEIGGTAHMWPWSAKLWLCNPANLHKADCLQQARHQYGMSCKAALAIACLPEFVEL